MRVDRRAHFAYTDRMRKTGIVVLALSGFWFLGASQAGDPLAEEIAKWSAFVHAESKATDQTEQARQSMKPGVERTEKALRENRRMLALQRLASIWANVGAINYSRSRPAIEHTDEAQFEAEWKRMGGVLHADRAVASPAAFGKLQPAAVRAVAEAAQPQIGIYYDASIDYSRSTSPEAGLYYVGSALAQKDFLALCQRLSVATPSPAPHLRSLAPDIESLQNEILRGYKPPASIDRHDEFILGNSLMKEARELDAAQLRYGALLRYLQGALRTGSLRAPNEKLDHGTLAVRLHEFEARLSDPAVDHSVGRIFLEAAQSEMEAAPGTAPPAAVAIAIDVLPRYFAALEPAKSVPSKPAPRVTVTLIRWPYT
jgi:hypothetical protein